MKKFVQFILCVAFLGAGVAGARYLIKTRPKPPRLERPSRAAIVEVAVTQPSTEKVAVPAMGTVFPARQVTLSAEVTGRVVEQNANLMPGGRLMAGAVVARLDSREYDLTVEQRKAEVERARFELKLEQGRQVVAEREWRLVGSGVAAAKTSRDLALRVPHLLNAKSALAAAQSGLDRAKLSVERTVIRAPFNAMVIEESVDVGQLVTPQSRLATIVGTDQFWVTVSLPIERLRWIALPDAQGAGGARARVSLDTGNGTAHSFDGQVLRLLADVAKVGRMSRLVVAVNDPLASAVPLLLGAYVRVEIEGGSLDNVFVVPRAAVHEGSRVWIMDEEDRLEIRTVDIAWRRRTTVLVNGGLEPGDRIVTNRLPAPIPGMLLRAEESVK